MTTKPQAAEPTDRIWCANCANQIYQSGEKWYHTSTAATSCNVTAQAMPPRVSANTVPTVDREKQARDLVDAFRFASPPVQSLRFLEWEPLVSSIACALTTAASPVAPQQLDELVDEVQHRMDQVVEAAVEWHQAGREGGGWFEAAEKLGAALDRLLELRSTRTVTSLPNAPEVDPNRKCWASTTKEICTDPRGCDERGCQRYTDEDYRSKFNQPTSRDIRAELITAHNAMPRRRCSVHKREEFKYESLEHELHAAPAAVQDEAVTCQRCGKLGGKVVSFSFDSITTSRWVCPHCFDAMKERANVR